MRRWRDHRMQRLWSRLVYLGRHEWPLLLSLLLVAGVIWTFAVPADAVIAGGTQAFDRAILLPMRAPEDPTRPVGLSWLVEGTRDYTALGSVGVLMLMPMMVIGFLLLQGKTRVAVVVVIAVVGGILLSTALKRGFARPRPAPTTAQSVYSHGRCDTAPADGEQPYLSRRALANRRPGRMDCRRGLGARVLECRLLAPTARRD